MRNYPDEHAPLLDQHVQYTPLAKCVVIVIAVFVITAIVWNGYGSLVRANYWLTTNETTFYIDREEQSVIGLVFFAYAIIWLWAGFKYFVMIYTYFYDVDA